MTSELPSEPLSDFLRSAPLYSLDRGLKMVHKAVELDMGHRYSEALLLYEEAVKNLKESCRQEEDLAKVAFVLSKTQRYVDRISTLQACGVIKATDIDPLLEFGKAPACPNEGEAAGYLEVEATMSKMMEFTPVAAESITFSPARPTHAASEILPSSAAAASSEMASASAPAVPTRRRRITLDEFPCPQTQEVGTASRVWQAMKKGGKITKMAYQAKQFEQLRKQAGVCRYCQLLEGQEPLGVGDPIISAAAGIAALQKLCSLPGPETNHRGAIEALGQRVVHIAYVGPIAEGTGPELNNRPIHWFAARSREGVPTLSICFRGTRKASLTDWLANAEAEPFQLNESSVNIHLGIYQQTLGWMIDILHLIIDALADDDPPARVLLSGHSKGGGSALILATLLMMRPHWSFSKGIDLRRLSIFTFGAPLVTHTLAPLDFYAIISLMLHQTGLQIFNFVNEHDPVPRILGKCVHVTADGALVFPVAGPDEDPDLACYYPLGRYFFFRRPHGPQESPSAVDLFEVPDSNLPLLTKLLELPVAFSEGFTAARMSHKMGCYLDRLAHLNSLGDASFSHLVGSSELPLVETLTLSPSFEAGGVKTTHQP